MDRDARADDMDAAAISMMTDGDVNKFLRDQIDTRSLHRTMRRLNADILSDDTTRRVAARKALDRLGFV